MAPAPLITRDLPIAQVMTVMTFVALAAAGRCLPQKPHHQHLLTLRSSKGVDDDAFKLSS